MINYGQVGNTANVGGGNGAVTVTGQSGSGAGSDNVATSAAGTVNPVDSLYLVGLVLFVATLVLNMLGDRMVRKYRQAY